MTDDVLVLRITFHGPFHVLTGSADDGVDATVDEATPLPESSVKGVMRASALRLGLPPTLVGEVFGSRAGDGQGGPWSWTVGRVVDGPGPQFPTHKTVRGSGPIDDLSGTARAGLIRMAEESWSAPVEVRIERDHWVPPERRQLHLDVLRCAARGVITLGHDRNRGYGWISIDEPELAGPEQEAVRLAGWLLGPGPAEAMRTSADGSGA